MITSVFFRGEMCWVENVYIVQSFTDETQNANDEILFELVAVESASVGGRYRSAVAKLSAFAFLPSSMDFSTSEWSTGVSNGQTK